MSFDPNLLYYRMSAIYSENKTEDTKVIIVNEGGTRSAKTWDAFHLLYTFCDHNPNRGLEIYVLRDTLDNCREKTFKDFQKCMQIAGVSKNITYRSEGMKPTAYINGNEIRFRGLDKASKEGYPSDIVFVNEILDTQKVQLDGIFMRCRMLIIADENPKYTEHWSFDLEKRDNCFFTHTTFLDNKHLQKSIVNEILGYEPWQRGSYEIIDNELIYKGELISKNNQPPVHKRNKEQGTIDEFKWIVYGLGLRGAMRGVIYQQMEFLNEFPEIDFFYANDFGFTNDPNATVKYAEDANNIWFELLIYEPIDNADALSAKFKSVGIDNRKPMVCDSADRYAGESGVVRMVNDLNDLGFDEAFKVKKTKDIMYWIGSAKSKKIHCVKDDAGLWKKVQSERQNYVFKEVHGIPINQPIDGHDHALTAMRYGHMTYNAGGINIYW